jgi:integrase
LWGTSPQKTKLSNFDILEKRDLRVTSPLGLGFKSLPARHCVLPVPFETWLREYVREPTAFRYTKMIRQLSRLGDISNPDKIRTLICTHQVSEGRKEMLANTYDYYVRYNGLTWTKPRFTREEKPIFLPLESELDQLISNARDKMSIFLQFLKETGADAGEAWKLRWIDVNTQSNKVGIIPTKNHSARTLVVSSNMISRLMTFPHANERVFASKNLDRFRWRYQRMRNDLSKKLENPRLNEIAFKTFRHWKATHEYYRTKDILHVKQILGHKRIENTLIYTHLVHFESDDYLCKTAKTLLEATALIEAGFEYVTEMDGVKLFRKRK